MLQVSSSGGYRTIDIATVNDNGVNIPNLPTGSDFGMGKNHAPALISNGADGVLLSWGETLSDNQNTCPSSDWRNHLTAVSTGGGVSTHDGPRLPGQTVFPVSPLLQRQDGTFVGAALIGPYCVDWDWSVVSTSMVTFTADGSLLGSVANEEPRIATADNRVIGKSGIVYDQGGSATGTATSSIYSWTGNTYRQQGAIEQISSDLLFVLSDIASTFGAIAGGNYSHNGVDYALVRTFQNNVTNPNVYVTNPTQTNPNQQTITNVLNVILQALNSGSVTSGICSQWLTGAASISISTYITTGLLAGQNYGHGTFNDVRTGAISGYRNSNGTLAGVPVNYAFTVNDQGAFFNATTGKQNFFVGRSAYAGNTLLAQATILIHELAHQMNPGGGAAGFQNDAGNEQAGRDNDLRVAFYCGYMIRSLP